MPQRTCLMVAMLMLMQLVMLAMPQPAHAQTPPAGSEVCTNFADGITKLNSGTPPADPNSGLLSSIYIYIKDIVDTSTQKLYDAFVGSAAYQKAVFGALTLMIIIFGVGFLIGVIQPSFGQVLVRLIKFGIIITLISPGGWAFFNNNMVTFFNDGTDDLIKIVMNIGADPGNPIPTGATPFYYFDRIAEFIIQPDTIIAITGSTFAGGPFGLAMGGLLIFAVGGFIELLIKALRTYAVSYVARSLLLGLAPVFFIFLLFEKTKQLFMTWVNALVALMLQPVLLFTFLSFFIVLIQSAATDMLAVDFCWTEYRSSDGTTNKVSFWRPVDKDTKAPVTQEFTWKGSLDCILSGKSNCPEFPLNVVDTLTFLILIYIAKRFAGVIERIANELSNSYIALDAGGRFDQFMQGQKGQQTLGTLGSGGNWNPGRMGRR